MILPLPRRLKVADTADIGANQPKPAVSARGMELVRAQLASATVSEWCMKADNSLVVYELSATMTSLPGQLTASGPTS
jgi:hypothetical protein